MVLSLVGCDFLPTQGKTVHLCEETVDVGLVELVVVLQLLHHALQTLPPLQLVLLGLDDLESDPVEDFLA